MKECRNHSGNLINREYCFRRNDIDVKVIPKGDLTIKLASSEVGIVVKRRIFLVFPYRTLISNIRDIEGFYSEIQGNSDFFTTTPTSDDTNFIIRSSLGSLWTSISIVRKQYFRFMVFPERSEQVRSLYIVCIYFYIEFIQKVFIKPRFKITGFIYEHGY